MISLNNEHKQARRRPLVSYVPNAAPSRNLGKAVVAVAAVLGSKTVEALVTQDFSTRGTRAYMPAKHRDSPGQPSVSRQTLLNKKVLTLPMALARWSLRESSRPPNR